jgi:hypothetical protein
VTKPTIVIVMAGLDPLLSGTVFGGKNNVRSHVMAVLDTAIHAAPQRGCFQSIRNGTAWMTGSSPRLSGTVFDMHHGSNDVVGKSVP